MFAVNRAAEILVWFVGLDAPDLGMTSSQLPPSIHVPIFSSQYRSAPSHSH